MNIGIVTCWKSMDNYGQQMQCYALQTLLRSWGHDAYLIRYAPKNKKKYPIGKSVKNMLLDVYSVLYIFFVGYRHKHSVRKETLLRHINDKENRIRRFEEFRRDNIKMSPQIYHSIDELQTNPPEADIYITGSDQVWHDSYLDDSISGWFLQFGKENVRRLSYAASIGRNLYEEEIPIFCKFLRNFNAISVREESTRKLCEEQGFKAQVCIDPTMLLPIDTYKNLAINPSVEKEYAFMYVLNVKSQDDFYWAAIKSYLDERNLELKSVTGSGYYQGRELIEGQTNMLATIPEWIGYIQNAQCVFTTSFHGTVFAILMHRPFLTICLKGKYSISNSRMDQLLDSLGLSERKFDPKKSVKEQMESPINWDTVEERHTLLKKESIVFLNHNLF